MPSPSEILSGLAAIANEYRWAAIVWHLLIAIALIAIARGWRPTWRLAGTCLALPLASVAVFGFTSGNPFNGMVFTGTAAGLIALAMTSKGSTAHPGSRWATAAGLGLIAFGWLYPHFLVGSPLAYLYAAPTGLVPCPTLATVIGFALLAGLSVPRGWALLLGAVGLIYGVIGVGRLGVSLDVPLIVGAVLLAARAVASRGPSLLSSDPAAAMP